MLSPVAFFSALGRTACRGSAAAADPDERCYRLYRPACGCATRGFGTVCLVNRTSFTLLALVGAVLLACGLFAFQMPSASIRASHQRLSAAPRRLRQSRVHVRAADVPGDGKRRTLPRWKGGIGNTADPSGPRITRG